MDIGGVTIPSHNQAEMIEQITQFATYNPAMVGDTFFTDLSVASPFPNGVQQFDPITVNNPNQRGFNQKMVYIRPMGVE